MSLLSRWAARVSGVVAVVMTGLLVAAPAAFAGTADEVARRGPRVGRFGVLGTVCCLAAVLVVVLVALAMARRRQPPRR